MAVDLSNLYKKPGLKSLDEFLSGKTYISGDQLTNEDITVFAAVWENPGDAFPNVDKWCKLVASHLVASILPDDAKWARFSCKNPASSGAAKIVRRMRLCVKHAVLLEFYPWNRQTDSKKLEEAVRSVEMTGLWWGQSKLVPDYFGINNLKIVLITVHYLAPVRCVIRDCLRASSEHAQNCSLVARCDIDAWFNDVA